MTKAQGNSADPRKAVRQKLESLERAGVTHLPKRKVTAAAVKAEAATVKATVKAAVVADVAKPQAIARVDAAAPAGGASAPESRLAALSIVQKEVAACARCPQLCDRTQTVFGVGNPNARLVFLGEAPGADEDRTGEPFVGRAGQLLTKIIEACTLKREDVYILNVLKCRPPGNRPPLPEEAANCRPFLDRQLEIIQPEFICCLGTTAAQALLGTDQTIGKLRGRFHKHGNATVMCTYHPSYLLRNPPAKRDVWEDMKLLLGKMGIELA